MATNTQPRKKAAVKRQTLAQANRAPQPTGAFAARFLAKHQAFVNVWRALARGETPENPPKDWKGVNYWATAFSQDANQRVRQAAQTFISDLETARIDPHSYVAKVTEASQRFAWIVCREAGVK